MKKNGNEMLNVIDRSVEQANDIIADLLDYSREIHLELEICSKLLMDSRFAFNEGSNFS